MATTTGADGARFDRRAWCALGLLVALSLASLAWLAHPWYEASDETNDAAIYLACAKSIVAHDGYSYLGTPFTIRPPGMSLVLAPILAWRGMDFHAIHLWVSAFGVACVALLFAHARPRLGSGLAFLVAACVWLDDGFRALCNQAMSDVPGMALVLACLAIERWAAREPSWKRDVVLGIVIGLSAYVRTIAGLLVPAIALARILARARPRSGVTEPWPRFLARRVAPIAAVAAMVVAPWAVRDAIARPTGPVDQNFLHSYSTAMWHVDGGDPSSPRRSLAEIAGRVPVRAVQVLETLGARMKDERGPVALGAVFLACLLVVAARRREPAEIFAVLALGVVLLYFGFRARLVLPIWMLALPATAECVRDLARRAGGERVARGVTAALLLALPALDFRPRAGWDEIERTDRAFRAQAAAVAPALDRDARVASAIGWHWAIYLDRPVWSLYFAARRDGLDAIDGTLKRHGIDRVILWPALASDRGLVAWFEAHHGPSRPCGSMLVFDVGVH